MTRHTPLLLALMGATVFVGATARCDQTCALYPVEQMDPTTWLYAAEFTDECCNNPQLVPLMGFYSWPEECDGNCVQSNNQIGAHVIATFAGLPGYVKKGHNPIIYDPVSAPRGCPSSIAREHSKLIGKPKIGLLVIEQVNHYFWCRTIRLQLKGNGSKEIRFAKELNPDEVDPEEDVEEFDFFEFTDISNVPNTTFAYDGKDDDGQRFLLLLKREED